MEGRIKPSALGLGLIRLIDAPGCQQDAGPSQRTEAASVKKTREEHHIILKARAVRSPAVDLVEGTKVKTRREPKQTS
jgi:hypothetical protein